MAKRIFFAILYFAKLTKLTLVSFNRPRSFGVAVHKQTDRQRDTYIQGIQARLLEETTSLRFEVRILGVGWFLVLYDGVGFFSLFPLSLHYWALYIHIKSSARMG